MNRAIPNFVLYKLHFKLILISLITLGHLQVFSQGAAINTTGAAAAPSAILDISSSNQGVLIPRLTELQKKSIASPEIGLIVFQTDGTSGLWLFDSIGWVQSSGSQQNAGSSLNQGTAAGNTPYWDGTQWIVSSWNLYNDGSSIGIGTNAPDPSAVIDINSTSKGALIPRMTTAERDLIQSPAEGLLIFNITTKCFESYVMNNWNSVSCPANCFAPNTPGTVFGELQPCSNTSFNYSITQVNTATNYEWIVPAGWIINSGQGTEVINVTTGAQGQNGIISVQAANTCGASAASTISVISSPYLPASLNITANPQGLICYGDNVTFTALPVNGGSNPSYQWKINGVNAGTNSNIFSTNLLDDNDEISCVLTSNALCVSGSPAISDTVKMSVMYVPPSPSAASHNPGPGQIEWNWNIVAGATGYKYNTANNYLSATDNGINTSTILTGLSGNTTYNLYVWAYNNCGPSIATLLTATTTFSCGSNINIVHVAGNISPVNKTTSYSTTASSASGSSKCWITKNLGADTEATSVTDPTEQSSGWYWQFNRKQGFKHDGSTRTPNTSWITSINESSNWLPANDPCALILGSGWRLPTYTEYNNFGVLTGWVDYSQAYNAIKFVSAGELSESNGTLGSRGSYGRYWTSTQTSNANGNYLRLGSGYVNMGDFYKHFGFSVRCLKD